MSEQLLVPSIEQRLAGMLELTRRMKDGTGEGTQEKAKPTITISREFGCEAFPMAERLKELLEAKTRESWAVMDKELLEEAAKRHDLSMEIFASLGKKNRFMDEIIATFSSRWKSQKDYFQLLGGQILSIAATGNVIIIGRGSSVIAQELKNCFHFRMYASHEFKVKSIARRAKISPGEADALIDRRQKERDKFVRDFLDCDARDLRYYHLVFNNDKNPADRIAKMIVSYVFP